MKGHDNKGNSYSALLNHNGSEDTNHSLCLRNLSLLSTDSEFQENSNTGQNLSTLSPAIIFGPMFQKSDDPAIQEDPQQTAALIESFNGDAESVSDVPPSTRHSASLSLPLILQPGISEPPQPLLPASAPSAPLPAPSLGTGSQQAAFGNPPALLQPPEVPVAHSTQFAANHQEFLPHLQAPQPIVPGLSVVAGALASAAAVASAMAAPPQTQSTTEPLPAMVQTLPLDANSVLTSNPTLTITPTPSAAILQPSLVMGEQNLQWILNGTTSTPQTQEQIQQASKVEKVFFTTAVPVASSTGSAVQQIGLSVPVIIIKQEEACQCQCACRDSAKERAASRRKGCPSPPPPTLSAQPPDGPSLKLPPQTFSPPPIPLSSSSAAPSSCEQSRQAVTPSDPQTEPLRAIDMSEFLSLQSLDTTSNLIPIEALLQEEEEMGLTSSFSK